MIFAFPTEAALEAKAATQGTNIPVVFDYGSIEGMGLVDSVRNPGGNITGVRYPSPDIALKRFEIMLELLPGAKQVLVPYQKGYPNVPPQLEALRPAAQAAGVKLIEVPAENVADLKAQLQALAPTADNKYDAFLFLAEPLAVTVEPFTVIGKFATEYKIPMGGVLMSAGGYDSIYGVNVEGVSAGKLAAPLLDKVFKGIAVGTIPVFTPEFDISINYKVAQAQGITVPQSLLQQAKEIIR